MIRRRALGSLGAVSSNLPISSPYRSTPEAPVTEAERNQLSTRLNAAFEAGSLDADDYHQRLDVLFAAQKMGQLVPVVEGLPPLQTYTDPAIVAGTGGAAGRGLRAAQRDRYRAWSPSVGWWSLIVLIAISAGDLALTFRCVAAAAGSRAAGTPGSPPPPQHPRNRTLLAVLIVLLASIVAVVAFGAVLISQQPDPQAVTPPAATTPGNPSPTTLRPVSPPPRTPSPSATPTPTPTEAPTPTEEPTPTEAPSPTEEPTPDEPAGPEDVLVRNPFYDRRIPDSDCAQPPRPLPTSAKADVRYLKAVIDCMADAYREPLEAAGFTLTRPGVVVYRGTVETPCGQGLKGYPVFYCPANQTVYSSAGSTEEYGDGLRLGRLLDRLPRVRPPRPAPDRCAPGRVHPRREAAPDQPPDRAPGGLLHGDDRDLGPQHAADRSGPSRDGSLA